MLDLDMIDECDDCDGEAVHCYGYNPISKAWEWHWVPIEELVDSGRMDIVELAGR